MLRLAVLIGIGLVASQSPLSASVESASTNNERHVTTVNDARFAEVQQWEERYKTKYGRYPPMREKRLTQSRTPSIAKDNLAANHECDGQASPSSETSGNRTGRVRGVTEVNREH